MTHTTRKGLSLVLALALLFSTVPAAPAFAVEDNSAPVQNDENTTAPQTSEAAAGDTYLDKDSKEQNIPDNITEITNNNPPTTWGDTANAGWYIVEGTVTIDNRVTVSGDVHLILADGAHLTVNGGIGVSGGNSFTIYAQSTGEGMGTLIAQSNDGSDAGIGGTGGIFNHCGTITINGGDVTATGGRDGAGIGGGDNGNGGSITINGGDVRATGGRDGGAGIGGGDNDSGGDNGNGGSITINGGDVTATGGSDGAGIGGGDSGDGGTITINGGDVTANGGSGGAGIGGGYNGGIITINGGDVTATGGTNGAGIGGGDFGDGGIITINGGDVRANGGSGGAGIGGGYYGDGGSFFTGTDGQAVIIASSISDQSGKPNNWSGLIIEENAGKLYGSIVTPTEDFTVPENTIVTIDAGKNLVINEGVTMTNNGNITNNGTIVTIKNNTINGSGLISGNQPVTVTGINLSPSSQTVKVGETATLTATLLPEGVAGAITWTSDNTNVATVSNGEVTGVAPGAATITASIGNLSAECTVTVKAVPVESVSLDQTELSLDRGKTAQLTATVAPADATNQSVTWTSSDPTVATVDMNGLVTAVAPGSATITVTTTDGEKTATCAVTVTIPVTGVSLDQTTLSLDKDETAQLKVTVAPADATNQSVTWTSSDPTVATVDTNGNVTAVGAGTATITVTTTDGSFTAACTVTVKAEEPEPPVEPDDPPYSGDYNYAVQTSACDHGQILLDKEDRYATAGETISFTVVPEDGYEIASVSVTTREGDSLDLTDEGDGVYSFIMPETAVTLAVTFVECDEPEEPEQPEVTEIFSDLLPDAWYLDDVQYVYDHSLMTGVGDSYFAPESAMTRAMFVSVLARYAGDDTPAAPGEPWYAGAQQWAVANGVSDGTMMDDAISREQLVTMLYRYAGEPAASGDLSAYSDVSTISGYAQEAMRWAVGEGILGGMTADTLAPQGQATRAQVAAFFHRFVEGQIDG